MTASADDFVLTTSDWVDLTATQPALANQQVSIQAKNPGGAVLVVWGGTKPTDTHAGQRLADGQTATNKAAHIWVRGTSNSRTAKPRLAIALIDPTPIASANPALVYGRTITIPAGKGNTPVALDNVALINSVVIKARSTNAGDVIISGVGDVAANGYPLSPGEPIGFSVTNLSAIQIYGAVGDGIHWSGN